MADKIVTREAREARRGALRFGCDGGNAAPKPRDGEFYYRVELPDGREALIIASDVTVRDGALVASSAETTLILAPGAWVSAYLCEAMLASDPIAIVQLDEPRS